LNKAFLGFILMLSLHCVVARKRFNFASYMLGSFWHACFSEECAENEDFSILASLTASSGGQLNPFLSKKNKQQSQKHKQTVCQEFPPTPVRAVSLQW